MECQELSRKVGATLAHSCTCVKPESEHPLATRRGRHGEARSKKQFWVYHKAKKYDRVRGCWDSQPES